MAFQMEVISKVVITPSSPTPNHLQKLNLSYIDQFNPSIFVPLVFFYQPPPAAASNSERLNQLKESLSEALTEFYPLAGRIDKNNTYINCNDKGVIFIEAQAPSKYKLIDVVNNPNLSEFLPFEFDDSKELCMIVQATCFSCGGLAVGVGISHKLVDGGSFFMFVNSWADISRSRHGGMDVISRSAPVFNSAALFPPRDLGGFSTDNSMVKKGQDMVTKCFLFTASKITALRQKYTKLDGVIPSRTEALSAFIWTRFMAAAVVCTDQAQKEGSETIYLLIHAVNLRKRADPPFPDCYFGNMYWPVMAVHLRHPIGNDKETGFAIVEKMRESINAIDANYVKELQKGDEQLNILSNTQKNTFKGKMITLSFSSFSRFPVYEVDFGWGKPIWVGMGKLAFKSVILLPSLHGDCIEAWINLSLEDMAKFEVDEELLSYVSSDRS